MISSPATRTYTNGSSQIQMRSAINTNNDICYDDDDSPPVSRDYFDGVFDYIKQILLEDDDSEYMPCMFHDCSALQATEKYFYDALITDTDTTTSPASPPRLLLPPDKSGELFIFSGGSSFSSDVDPTPHVIIPFQVRQSNEKQCGGNNSTTTKKKINHDRRDNSDSSGERNSKQLAAAGYTEDEEPSDQQIDKSLLCPKMNPGFYDESPADYSEESLESEDEAKKQYRKTKEVKRGRPKGSSSKKNSTVRDVVDLAGLVTRCAEAVSNFNFSTGEKFLQQIRQHSSAYGDANERLAHCFANSLQARMAGTGSTVYTAFSSRRIPVSELLKSYQAYISACPFKRMSNIFANKSIAKCIGNASKVHIIDFGIMYGFQWPCIIQGLSLRPGGPPMLKITGIDFPQSGFKPAERVEQTGRRLAKFCRRFNVPFEYNYYLSKRWDDIRVEDLKIERNELLVVNCLYKMRHVPDEYAAGADSPRDNVLKLIKKINPRLFVHGAVNGTYNASFFATRFREALLHYSSFFDMMEATLPRGDQDRLMYERDVLRRDVMNVIACEGAERVDRPETYKRWQVRNQRAGFKQVPLDKEIMREIKIKVSKDYHKDFLLDEDGGWMLQGWKGRVMYVLSCWKPTK